MEGIQAEIEKLLDVITVILLKLSEIENDIASDVKLILGKSKDEVILIQKSILDKYKQSFKENALDYHERFLKPEDSNLTIKLGKLSKKKAEQKVKTVLSPFIPPLPPYKVKNYKVNFRTKC